MEISTYVNHLHHKILIFNTIIYFKSNVLNLRFNGNILYINCLKQYEIMQGCSFTSSAPIISHYAIIF